MSTSFSLKKYDNIFFDCDGVILNSNQVKTDSFFDVASKYGEKNAYLLKEYHIKNGGVSRYQKFKYFINNILEEVDPKEKIYKELLENFSKSVRSKLKDCEAVKCLPKLKQISHNSKWTIVSGGNQEELHETFEQRGLSKFFSGGIFGSPMKKEDIMIKCRDSHDNFKNSLFIGDSIYDYHISKKFELDFIFISGWSEVKNHVNWCKENNIRSVLQLCDLN